MKYCTLCLCAFEDATQNFCVAGSSANYARTCEKGQTVNPPETPCGNGTVASGYNGGCTNGTVANGGASCIAGPDITNPYPNGCVDGTNPRELLPG